MGKTFIDLFVIFALISVVGLAVISFAGQMGVDNQANQTILMNPFINKTFNQLGGNITAAADTAEAQREAVEREQVEVPEGSFLLVSVVGTAKKFGDVLIGFYNITIGLIFNFIGFKTAISQMLATIVAAVIIFAGWKTFKTGT